MGFEPGLSVAAPRLAWLRCERGSVDVVCPPVLPRARGEQSARVARHELRRIRELTRAINDLERELAALTAALTPRCGPSVAAAR